MFKLWPQIKGCFILYVYYLSNNKKNFYFFHKLYAFTMQSVKLTSFSACLIRVFSLYVNVDSYIKAIRGILLK